MLSGDNGILQKSTEAKRTTERAEAKEQAQMDIMAYIADKTANHQDASLDDAKVKGILTGKSYVKTANETSFITAKGEYEIPYSELYQSNGSNNSHISEGSGGGGTGNLTPGPKGTPLINKTNIPETSHDKIIGEDEYGNQVVVPDGFKVADDSGTTVKDGIVIEDDDGNQYVWVPVSNINNDGTGKIKVNSVEEEGVEITLGRYTFSTNSYGSPTLKQKGSKYDETLDKEHLNTEYLIGSYEYELSSHQNSNFSSGLDGTNTTANNLAGFINSVNTNKGYYIARYEASYRTSGKAASKVSTATRTDSSTELTPGMLWNFIRQGDAATACQGLYDTINSDLMNSYAWDTAIRYIQAMGNKNYANANRGSNTSLKNTGETGDQKCKIFDMAGNTREWTTEYSSSTTSTDACVCVSRGGCCFNAYAYTVERLHDNAGHNVAYISFRSTLYL